MYPCNFTPNGLIFNNTELSPIGAYVIADSAEDAIFTPSFFDTAYLWSLSK